MSTAAQAVTPTSIVVAVPSREPSSFVELPSPVSTAGEFVAELRQLRTIAGQPSFRQLSRAADQRIASTPGGAKPDPLPPSTTSEVLAGKRLPRLPRLEFVESYVGACLRLAGLDEAAIAAEVARWRAAWCTLAEPEAPPEPVEAADPVPPRRGLALPLVVVVFLAGVGTGVAGTWNWASRPRATAASAPALERSPAPQRSDVCLPPESADPAGQDVLGRAARPWWVNNRKAATLREDGDRFRVDVVKGTKSPGDVLIIKSGVELVQGRPYALAFTALADRATTIRVRVQDSPPTYLESHTVDLAVAPSACRHVYRFVGAATSAQSELTFQVGGQAQDFRLTIADVVLVAAAA